MSIASELRWWVLSVHIIAWAPPRHMQSVLCFDRQQGDGLLNFPREIYQMLVWLCTLEYNDYSPSTPELNAVFIHTWSTFTNNRLLLVVLYLRKRSTSRSHAVAGVGSSPSCRCRHYHTHYSTTRVQFNGSKQKSHTCFVPHCGVCRWLL